jgi:hypothetical protein
VDYDSALNETRTNAEQSETGDDFRVSHESRIAELLQGQPFYVGPDTPCAPHLPAGSPERAALFAELRKTFVEDWAAAERSLKEEQRRQFGDLYFVAAGNAVKIGRTTNFGTRLRHIQAHNHENVECLALLKGEGWRERDLHRRFKDCHLRGEWFERCPEIEAEIERLSSK